jgi:hypothetical protein
MTDPEPAAPSGAMSITEHELARCGRANNPAPTDIIEMKVRGHAPDHGRRLARGRRHRLAFIQRFTQGERRRLACSLRSG